MFVRHFLISTVSGRDSAISATTLSHSYGLFFYNIKTKLVIIDLRFKYFASNSEAFTELISYLETIL